MFFIEIHDIPVDPVLKIVLTEVLPFTSQSSKFTAVFKLSFNVLFKFVKGFYHQDC